MVEIILTAANMGADCDERDFGAWEAFCDDHLAADLGITVDIGTHGFGNAPAEDTIRGATEEQRAEIRRWLTVDGWEAFCADASAWPKRQP